MEVVAFCGGHKSVKTLPHAECHSCQHEAEPLVCPHRCQPPVPRPPHRWQDLEFVPPLSMKRCAAGSTIVDFLWGCFFFFKPQYHILRAGLLAAQPAKSLGISLAPTGSERSVCQELRKRAEVCVPVNGSSFFFLHLLLAHKRPAPGGFIREVRQNIYPDNLGDCEETASISKLQSGADIKGELSVRGKQSRGEKQTRRGQEGGKKKHKKKQTVCGVGDCNKHELPRLLITAMTLLIWCAHAAPR